MTRAEHVCKQIYEEWKLGKTDAFVQLITQNPWCHSCIQHSEKPMTYKNHLGEKMTSHCKSLINNEGAFCNEGNRLYWEEEV